MLNTIIVRETIKYPLHKFLHAPFHFLFNTEVKMIWHVAKTDNCHQSVTKINHVFIRVTSIIRKFNWRYRLSVIHHQLFKNLDVSFFSENRLAMNTPIKKMIKLTWSKRGQSSWHTFMLCTFSRIVKYKPIRDRKEFIPNFLRQTQFIPK